MAKASEAKELKAEWFTGGKNIRGSINQRDIQEKANTKKLFLQKKEIK